MTRITVASPTDEFADRVLDVLGPAFEESLVRWWDEQLVDDPILCAGALASAKPAAVVFAGVDDGRALGVAERLASDHPEIGVVLVTNPTPDLYARALRAGVTDILPPDASSTTIDERLREVLGRWSKLSATAAAADEARGLGSVATILEPKGGSGKTSIMSNLAVVLSQKFPGEVVLVDLDLQFGDLTETLLLEPRYSMADVARTTGQLDATTLKAFLTRREDLFVLAAPPEPALADEVTPDMVSEVLDLLRHDFKWVLVDTAGGVTEHTLAAVEASTDLILLSSLDVLSNRSMKKTLRILDDLGIIVPRRHLVLNRSDSKVGLDRTEAIMSLGMRRAIQIPSNRAMPTSLNKGQPLVEVQPRAAISKRIADLAEELVTAAAASEEWST